MRDTDDTCEIRISGVRGNVSMPSSYMYHHRVCSAPIRQPICSLCCSGSSSAPCSSPPSSALSWPPRRWGEISSSGSAQAHDPTKMHKDGCTGRVRERLPLSTCTSSPCGTGRHSISVSVCDTALWCGSRVVEVVAGGLSSLVRSWLGPQVR